MRPIYIEGTDWWTKIFATTTQPENVVELMRPEVHLHVLERILRTQNPRLIIDGTDVRDFELFEIGFQIFLQIKHKVFLSDIVEIKERDLIIGNFRSAYNVMEYSFDPQGEMPIFVDAKNFNLPTTDPLTIQK